MAVLWVLDDNAQWLPRELADQVMDLNRRPPEVLDPAAGQSTDRVLLLRTCPQQNIRLLSFSVDSTVIQDPAG